MRFSRITVNPDQMGDALCIRGLGIPVATVIQMVADGMAAGEILAAYLDLQAADIDEALHFAPKAERGKIDGGASEGVNAH